MRQENNSQNKQSLGFSMVELLVTVAIGVFALILVMNAVSQFKGMINQVDLKAENETESNIGINVILKEINAMKFTYNSNNLVDDTGLHLFFDYYPDIPDAMSPAPITRTYTLTLGSPAFAFLTLDPRLRSTAAFSPSVAYSMSGGNAMVSGTASYAGINNSGFMVTNFPDIWNYDGILVFYSGFGLRPVGAPLTKVPQTSVFFAQRTPTDIINETLGGLLRNSHPVIVPTLNITTPDQFFRTLVPMSGVQTSLFLAAARPVRFLIMTMSGVPTLIKQTWNQNLGWSGDFVLIKNVNQVKFSRSSLASPVIDVDIDVP